MWAPLKVFPKGCHEIVRNTNSRLGVPYFRRCFFSPDGNVHGNGDPQDKPHWGAAATRGLFLVFEGAIFEFFLVEKLPGEKMSGYFWDRPLYPNSPFICNLLKVKPLVLDVPGT